MRLTASVKIRAAKDVLERGKSQDETALAYGCCRQSLYSWIKQYKRNPQKASQLLKNHYRRGFGHPRRLSWKIEKSVLDLVLKYPSLSVHDIAKELRLQNSAVSTYGVWRVLVRYNLQTKELRQRFSLAHPARTVFAHALAPALRVKLIEDYLEGKKISQICKLWKVSRPTFYAWLSRYKQATGDLESKTVEALVRRYKKGYDHHRSIGWQARELILDIVKNNPSFSVHKVYAVVPSVDGKPIVGHQAIQNLFVREGLNIRERRMQYAAGYLGVPQVRVAPLYRPEMPVYRLRQIIAPFATIPKLFLTNPIKGLAVSGLSMLPLVILTLWIRMLLAAPRGTSHIGLVFASIALFFGIFFFFYSVKYYMGILMVLKLAQSGSAKQNYEGGR